MKSLKIFYFILIVLASSCTQKSSLPTSTSELFHSDLKQPLELINPNNTEKTIILNQLYQKDSKKFANGVYNENGNSKTVSLNGSLVTMLDNNTKRYTYYIAPFEILESPTNAENFIGLFRYDNNANTIRHLDSFSVGNNSTVQKITNGYGNSINVTVANWSDISLKNNVTTKVSIQYTDTNFVQE